MMKTKCKCFSEDGRFIVNFVSGGRTYIVASGIEININSIKFTWYNKERNYCPRTYNTKDILSIEHRLYHINDDMG